MEESSEGATALDATSKIPIAQLNPLQPDSSSKAIKAVVTLTWPYSSATGTVAFLLSEPDFRLRRTRGQVRVQFAGSSAKAVKKAGIASGDEVVLGLDGVEWIQDEATVSTPGRGVEFELKFKETLLLQFKQEDSDEVKRINIDHPAPEQEVATPPLPTISEPEIQIASPSTIVPHQTQPYPALKDNEYSSPAFIKRARTSYGSMFDSDYDPFTEEDGTIAGRGRKRTRLSSSWRYSSRSPTPEAEATPEIETVTPEVIPKDTPVMTDEACQTTGLEDGNAAETLANFARQATNVGVVSYPQLNTESVPAVMVQLPQPLVHEHPTEREVLERAAVPPSPNLTPVPSELLPEVSPILTHKRIFGAESAMETDMVQNNQVPNAQEGALVEADPSFAEEDIYTASPQRKISTATFTSLNLAENTKQPPLDAEYTHDEMGAMFQQDVLNEALSSPQFVDEIGLSANGQERSFEDNDGIQSPNYEAPDEPQYPEIDDAMQDIRRTGWVPVDALNGYPAPEVGPGGRFEDEIDDEIYAPPPPRSVPMSRSQSARSAPIDLTESSDEEEEQDEGDYDDDVMQEIEMNPIYPGPGYAERAQAEDDEEEEESEEDDEDEEQRADRRAQAKQQYPDADEEEFDDDGYAYTRDRGINPEYEDEEEFSDDEEDVQNQYPLGQDPTLQEDFYDEDEEDEESYDEDEDEEEPRMQRAPVVIDLLSSDDEDDAPPPTPVVTRPTVPALQSQNAQQADEEDEESEEDGESEEDEEMINEQHVISGRRPSDTRIPQQQFIDEEDEDAVFEEETIHDEPSEEEDEDEEAELTPRKATEFRGSHQLDQDDDDIDAQNDQLGHGQLEDPFIEAKAPNVMQQKDPNRAGRSLPPMPKPPPSRGNLFGRMFNLDGANDGDEEVLCPILPRIPSPHVAGREANPTEPLSEGKSADQNTTQLPTPDATQMSHHLAAIDSQASVANVEASFETAAEEPSDDQIHSTHDQQAPIRIEAVEDIAEELPSSALASTTPAPLTIKVQSIEFLGEAVASENLSSSVQRETFESMEVAEETTTVLENGESGPSIVNQEIQALSITKETQKQAKEAMELPAEDHTVESLEPMEVEQETATVISHDGDAIVDEEEMETTMIDQDAERIAIEVMERNKEDNTAEAFDDDLLAGNYPAVTRSVTRSQSPPKKPNGRAEVVAAEHVYTRESPRRSHRRARSTTSTVHSEVEVQPVTPAKDKPISEPKDTEIEPTPVVVIKTAGTPKARDASIELSQETPTKGHDASIELAQETPTKGHDASIELALSALDSPDKRNKRDLRSTPVVDLKLRLSRILRTELSEFTSLKVLRYHINKKLDILAIATSSPPEATRAKSGPRNYLITFNITDPSTAPSSVTQVQVFRPYKDALPVLQAGDGILLRNFQVVAIKTKGFGLRSVDGEGSSWAVFKDGKEEVRGPPVEFGEKERGYMTALKGWYTGLEGEAKKKIMRANGEH